MCVSALMYDSYIKFCCTSLQRKRLSIRTGQLVSVVFESRGSVRGRLFRGTCLFVRSTSGYLGLSSSVQGMPVTFYLPLRSPLVRTLTVLRDSAHGRSRRYLVR